MSDSERSLQLFLGAFKAGDIAEPLASFDESTSAAVIRIALKTQHADFFGVRHSGTVAGWLARDDVSATDEPPKCRPFDSSQLIADTAPLNEVVNGLRAGPCLFVRSLGQIGGLICRNDLQKPAMRMWLFGLVTITELRMTRMIDEVCPNDSWRRYLSEGRLEKAMELQEQRVRRGQSRRLLECLHFADKGRIVARDESLRKHTRFESKRDVEHFVESLQDLRNNLAHAHELTGDWDVICDLATNLHRIVLGAPSKDATSATMSS